MLINLYRRRYSIVSKIIPIIPIKSMSRRYSKAILQNDEVLSLLTYVVSHISLGSFGSRGDKFVDEGVCVCGGEMMRVVSLRFTLSVRGYC